MNQPLTATTFQPHVGDAVYVADAAIDELILEAVSRGRPSPGAPREEPFTLVFSGPPEPILPQAIYVLSHPALGELGIFLVPIGPRPDRRMGYEAVFN